MRFVAVIVIVIVIGFMDHHAHRTSEVSKWSNGRDGRCDFRPQGRKDGWIDFLCWGWAVAFWPSQVPKRITGWFLFLRGTDGSPIGLPIYSSSFCRQAQLFGASEQVISTARLQHLVVIFFFRTPREDIQPPIKL